MMIEFQIWASYHPPLGFDKRGHQEFYWLSKCGRWLARDGSRKGIMILKDRKKDIQYVINGKLPEAEAKACELMEEEGGEQCI